MKNWFRGIIGGGKEPTPLDYSQSKELLGSAQSEDRLKVATNPGARPEVLYFLASDPEPNIRRAVAANAKTPVHADLILVKDCDDTVRIGLAGKIARLAPTMHERHGDKLKQMTYEALEALIQDQTVRVRQILSETIKDMRGVPHEIVLRLARDTELVVAGPVLQYSPVLTDSDLEDILRQLPIPGSATAIAQRVDLSPDLAHLIGTGEEIDAITALLKNKSAQIREETLDMVISRAPQYPAWHRPLVDRPRLSDRAVRNLARFVAHDLIKRLQSRVDLKSETLSALEEAVLKRIDDDEPGDTSGPAWEKLVEEARQLFAVGKLEEGDLNEALTGGRITFVRAALAVRTDLSYLVVEKILNAQSPKGVVALVWRAGLPMRFAARAQTALARVPPLQVLKPTAGGEYPLSEEAMNWQLDFFMDMVTE
jgi:uncharacterized protein (DUF2336 family)